MYSDIKYLEAVALLKQMIETPSFSKEEAKTGNLIENWLQGFGVKTNRLKNNIWAKNYHFDVNKPTILLNSHHDTVKPNKAYTRNPFESKIENGKLFGLGSNDAGGCVVSLLTLFVHFYKKENLNYNLIIAITAEEEISGDDGIKSLLPLLPEIDFAIVGEPTQMHLAIAEKGLLVLDAKMDGIPGHAAHENTENPIYKSLEDILWFQNYEFLKVSKTLGKVKMNVTQIQAGNQHNMVPAICEFVVDVRVNDCYTNEEVFKIIDENTKSEITARSFKLNSSSISENHPIVRAGIEIGRETYGSPTISDQTFLKCPSLKLGPGNSTRSHSADEFIYVKEIEEGIDIYIELLSKILI